MGSFLQNSIFIACNLSANTSASRCLAKGFGSMLLKEMVIAALFKIYNTCKQPRHFEEMNGSIPCGISIQENGSMPCGISIQ